jgi:hypothetical protein
MNDHALAVDIGDLEMAQLGRRRPVAYSIISMVRCIRLLAESISRATSSWSEYGRQSVALGKWNVIGKVRPPKRLDEEKTQCRSAAFDGPRRELALAKQMNLVLADVLRAKPLG